MDRFIAQENIRHFRSLLATELNEQKRQSILHLLSDEEAKLRSIEKEHKHGQPLQPKA